VLRHVLSAILAALVFVVAREAVAADTWLQVKSTNFTVLTNAGERKARNVAWQFEQVRAGIGKGWPWARVALDRPVFVIAVKDENTMRALAPQYWEKRGGVRPASIFVSTADRHYIALRTDTEVEEQGMNPYNTAFTAYSSLILQASFSRGLPLWLTNGLADVLGNTIVSDKYVQFGKPIPWVAELAKTGPRLPLTQLLAVTQESPNYRQEVARERFDAQSWSLVQYMMFGRKDDVGHRLNRVTRLLLDGVSSETAIREVYGSLEALDAAVRLYVEQGVYTYAQLQVESDTSSAKLPSRPVPAGESAAERAGFHAAMGRVVEARSLLAEARKSDPSLAMPDAFEGMLLDRVEKTDDARQAFAKATAAGSSNFWVHFRLASLMWAPQIEKAALGPIQTKLERATELNGNFAPAFAHLATVRMHLEQLAPALVAAQRAVELDPASVDYRLLCARLLARLSRQNEAMVVAKDAMSYAKNDQQRSAVQAFLTSAGQRMP
jgi:tetratricopeptide (TPR) repeat protein